MIVIGRANDTRKKIMNDIHSPSTRGHSEIYTSYLRGKAPCYWKGMKHDFYDFGLQCVQAMQR